MLKITCTIAQHAVAMSGCGKFTDHSCGISARMG